MGEDADLQSSGQLGDASSVNLTWVCEGHNATALRASDKLCTSMSNASQSNDAAFEFHRQLTLMV